MTRIHLSSVCSAAAYPCCVGCQICCLPALIPTEQRISRSQMCSNATELHYAQVLRPTLSIHYSSRRDGVNTVCTRVHIHTKFWRHANCTCRGHIECADLMLIASSWKLEFNERPDESRRQMKDIEKVCGSSFAALSGQMPNWKSQ